MKRYAIVVLASVIGFLLFIAPNFNMKNKNWDAIKENYMPSRVEYMDDVIELYQNGDPNIASYVEHTTGWYMLGGIIGKTFDISAVQIIWGFQFFAMALMVLFLPSIYYYLFSNIKMAIIFPFLIFIFNRSILFTRVSDVYWTSPWAFIFSFPFLLFLYKQNVKNKKVWIARLSLLIVFAIANLSRMSSAIIPMMMFLLICIRDYWRLSKTKKSFLDKGIVCAQLLLFVIVIFISSNMLSVHIPKIMMQKSVGTTNNIKGSSVWHNILIGMGIITNDYGLYYSDESGSMIVSQKYPDIKYGSPEYYNACKKLVFQYIKEDPTFAIAGFSAKIGLALAILSGTSIMAIVTAIIVFFILIKLIRSKIIDVRQIIQPELYIYIYCFLGMFLGLYQSILAYPTLVYQLVANAALNTLVVYFVYMIFIKNAKMYISELHNKKMFNV